MRTSFGRRLFGLSKGIYEGCTDLQRVLAFRAVGLRRNSGHGLKLGFRYGTLGPTCWEGAVGPVKAGPFGGRARCSSGAFRRVAPPYFSSSSLSAVGSNLLEEDRARGTGVGGEPVEVFFGELFCGVAASVDDTYWVVSTIEDWDGQRARPAGVGAGLRETPGTGYHEGGLVGV